MRKVLVKVGGETLQDAGDRARLAADLAVACAGSQLCVVHGAGPQITRLAGRLGVPSVMKGGRRVTDAAMLEAVGMAMAGEVGPQLLSACLAAGVPAVSTPACSGRLVVGRKRPPRAVAGEAEPVDFGLVADVAQVEPRLLEALWHVGLVPVLSSLVADDHGQLLNLNADTLVTSLVQAVGFDDVVLVTGVPGVFGDLADPASHLPELDAARIPELIAAGVVTGGMVAKLEEVAAILRQGAERVWIVGFREPSAIAGALSAQPGTRTLVRRLPAGPVSR